MKGTKEGKVINGRFLRKFNQGRDHEKHKGRKEMRKGKRLKEETKENFNNTRKFKKYRRISFYNLD